MRIAFLSSRYPPDFIGGGEWSTKYIAEGIAQLGHEVVVFCGGLADKEEKINKVLIKRKRDLYGLWAKPLFEKNKSTCLAEVLKKELAAGFEITHAHDFRSAQALALTQTENSVVTVRDFAPICGTTNNMWHNGAACDGCTFKNVILRCQRVREASLPRKPFRVWQYKFNLGFRNATYLGLKNQIFISEALRKRVGSRLKLPQNIAIIPNPVSPEWLASVKPVLSKKIVYAGTVDDYKGVKILFEAFSELQKTLNDVELIIVGEGKVARYKKYLADKHGAAAIRFVGKKTQEEVREFFDQAAVVVQPSVWEEPFGRTIIEAYARGRAVVASNIGGIKETFKEGTGYLVEPGSVGELREALKKIISGQSETKKMGALGREYAEQNYAAKIIAEKYLEFYKTVA